MSDIPQDPKPQKGTGLSVSDLMPKNVSIWESALSALLREKFDGATVEHSFQSGKTYTVRVRFGKPLSREEAGVVQARMLEVASNLARTMRHIEEDTALDSVQRQEEVLREAKSLLHQASKSISSGTKSASDLTATWTLVEKALTTLYRFLPPGTIPTFPLE